MRYTLQIGTDGMRANNNQNVFSLAWVIKKLRYTNSVNKRPAALAT